MEPSKKSKLGVVSGVYIPVCLGILSVLMFLRFGLILGQVGLLGILGLLVTAYFIDFLTVLSLSAIASNGEVKGGGAYYLISRTLGPEFGGSIGVLFYLSQVLNTALNVVGLVDCVRLNVRSSFPHGYWRIYGLESGVLFVCTALCLAGSSLFARVSNGLLVILSIAIISIPISALFKSPFHDEDLGVEFTGLHWATLAGNLLPHTAGASFKGFETFRDLFGILFPATSGIFAGASMSGDLRSPSKAIPKGTLWAILTTFIAYVVVVVSMAASTTHASFLRNDNIVSTISLSSSVIFAGECAVTFFSALLGTTGAAKLMQALARDKLLPGLSIFGRGTKLGDEPIYAIILSYALAQVALLANLDQIATFVAMGYQMTFFVMNLACFLLKIGSAPNFRPAFKFFSWQTAAIGSLTSAAAMFFVNTTYAASAVCLLVFLFSLIHYLSPPKRWGDVSQNLIYHQVRKYLLRLKPEHIKFWRPQIILLVNDARNQTRLIQFCNSLKKGSLYIIGHVIVTNDFSDGVHEARLQQAAWTDYISEVPRLKAFVQFAISPSINWGVRNLILSAGLGGMRPNVAVLGSYNMDELRKSNPTVPVPGPPMSPTKSFAKTKTEGKLSRRRRKDTFAKLTEGFLPTDVLRTEDMMSATDYMTILEDLALRYRLNVAIGKGFDTLEAPRKAEAKCKKHIDLWPIQISAELLAGGKSVLTTNFDTYTLILQLGYILHSVPTWKRAYTLRVLVFVEYESEVGEEHARVKALLDKLRIEAEVVVFWLASGHLQSYELIINGRCDDLDTKIMVSDVLRDEEWWDELQEFRGESEPTARSKEPATLANIIESTEGRPRTYSAHTSLEEVARRRRASTVNLSSLSNPTASRLSRLGVNIGIHTTHISDDVLDDPSDTGSSSQSSAGSDSEYDDVASDEDIGAPEPASQPLLHFQARRKDHSDILGQDSPPKKSRNGRERQKSSGAFTPISRSYGTMSSKTLTGSESGYGIDSTLQERMRDKQASPLPLESETLPRTTSARSLNKHSGMDTAFSDLSASGANPSAPPSRPSLSRQSSAVRFSSRPVPETKITAEGNAGPTIMFAEASSNGPAPERPPFLRAASTGRLPSHTQSETTTRTGKDSGQVTFAEPASHSRRPSNMSNSGSTDGIVDMSESLPDTRRPYGPSTVLAEGDEGAPYATQGMALSFNDLPSRAQHLILNELMRQNSSNTVVLFTTLPIPAEGTCEDDLASIQYLADVEVLCNELPPVLLVLSNNMTVTVSI